MVIKSLLLIVVLFMLSFSVTLTGQTLEKKEAGKKVAGSKLVKLDEKSKSIQYVQMKEDYLYSSKSKEAWLNSSLRFTQKHRANMVQEEVDRKGFTHTKYQICYKDLPVEGSVYTVHSINGRIQSASGKYDQGQDISVTPTINERDAFDKAVGHVHAKKYLWETENSTRPQGKLTILPVNEAYLLTYKFDIYAVEPLSRQYVFVNAHSGEVVKTLDRIHFSNADGLARTMYNGTVSIKTDSYNGRYRLRETGRGKGIETYNLRHSTSYGSAVDFTDTDNHWTDTTNYDQAAFDAHYAAEATYDYYFSTFGRNSFDNKGSKIMSYVHYDHMYNNAFWDGTRMTYGDGDGVNFLPLTPIEVVAHEITHAVTEHSANLVYAEESGALNESFSDIFGTVIDFYKHPQTANYLIGDVMSPTNNAFRSMQNPNDYICPDTYQGLYWDPSQEVHTNSGVQNHWFYLLCEGGTGTNDLGNVFSVNAIGMEKAAQIAYRNLTVYLTPNSTYADARFYSIQSAIDLFGECSPEVMAVTNAWHAVGVGEQFSNGVIANFNTSKLNACDVPAQIRFYNQSARATSYLWDFGDGETDTTKNPVHTYKATGDYIVRLISKGNVSCSNTDTLQKTITITQVPSPVSASCTPRTLSPGSGGIYSFQFNTIDKSSNGSSENYQDYTCTDTTTVTEGRKYKIALRVGIENPENVYVWVDLNNNGKFDETGEMIFQKNKVSRYCEDSLFIPAGALYNIPLRLRVGTDDAAYPLTDACTDSHHGQYQDYTLFVRENKSVPQASFLSNKKNIISGDTIQFRDNTMNLPEAWAWSFPGGTPSSSTQKNPKVTYSTPGSYDVSLTITNAHGSDSMTKTGYITVSNQAPQGLIATINNHEAGAVSLKWSAINDVNVYEDFEDGIADNFVFLDSCFTVENGYLKASGTADNDWKNARLEKEFDNFLLEYKFQQLQGNPGYSMGCFIRSKGMLYEQDANGYLIDIATDGTYLFGKLTEGQFTSIIPLKTTTALNTKPGAWNIVTVEAIDNLINVYINGQYVDGFRDDTFASGKINLSCLFGQPNNYDIRWDYMNVIAIEAPLSLLQIPKATNTVIAGADVHNFRQHPLVNIPHQFVEPKSIISQLENIQHADILTSYKIYRDSVLIHTSNQTACTDTLPKYGTYQYHVTAMFDGAESKATNTASVTWGPLNALTGDNCSSAQDLADLKSPYFGNTIDYQHDFDYCNMGLAPDRIFYLDIPANHALVIGLEQPYYDMQSSLRIGGACPGTTEIACVDEPDDKLYTYMNMSDSVQRVYYILSGYDGASGYFDLFWKLSPVARPIADFSANTTIAAPGEYVYFTDNTKETTTTWKWSFPGGQPSFSNLQNPSVIYDSLGTYDVQLIVSNALGSDSILKTSYITVSNQAYCVQNLGGSNKCPGDITAVSIKGTTLNNTNHSNCSTSNRSNYGYYPAEDNTMATLKTDTIYELSVTTINKDKISVWIDYNQNGAFESSEWTQVSAASEPEKPSIVHVAIPYTALAGETRMRIRSNFYLEENRAEDACTYFTSGSTEDYDVFITQVPKKPTASFTVKQTVVVGENVQFTDLSNGVPTSWKWSFPGAEPSGSTLQHPVVSYSAAGTYDVKLVVTNALGSDSIVKTGFVTVRLAEKPVTDFIASLTKVTTGTQVNFFDNSTHQPTSWKWILDGGTPSVSTDKNASTVYEAAGVYDVKLVASNAGGADSIMKAGYITVTDPQKPLVNFYTNTGNTLAGATVCFHDRSENDPVSWQWTFEGGTPSASTEKNPCVIYETPGTFAVKLRATNAQGTDSLTKAGYMTIMPAPAPLAKFSVNTTTEASGAYVYFKDISSNYPTSWKWTFEGGTPSTSTSSEDSVMYTNPGTYDVKLVVSNASGSDSIISKGYMTITIPPKPIADFRAWSRYTDGGLMDFQDLSLNKPTSWKWICEGGDPYTTTERSPIILYNKAGIYDVTLIVTNSAGSDTITKKNYVYIFPMALPIPDFTASTRNTEINTDVIFQDNSYGTRSLWEWTFEGATPSSATGYSTTVRYSKSGTYDVKLVVGNTAGKDSIIRKDYIRVNPPPVPVASFYANKTTVLKTSTIVFSSNSSWSTSWKWTFPGGKPATSNERAPSIIYNTPGVYDVKLVVINESGSDSITQTGYITVVSQLKPEANYFVKNTTVQSGSKVTFVNTSLNTPTSFKWKFAGGTPSSSTSKSPVITYNAPGVYDVKLVVSNAAGTDSVTREGLMHIIGPDFKVDNAVTCLNEQVQFTDLTNDHPTSWSWLFPGGVPSSSNLENPTVVYQEAGAKSVTLTVNGTFKVTKANFVVVNEMPTAEISQVGNMLVSNNLTGNQWYSLSDGIIQEATGQSFVPAKNDRYYLRVTIDGCSSAISDTLDYVINDSKPMSLDEQLNIYPLPVKQFLYLESHSEIESIEVTGIAGDLIIRQENIKTQKHQLDMSHYSSGIYILKAVISDNPRMPVIRKIIKNN